MPNKKSTQDSNPHVDADQQRDVTVKDNISTIADKPAFDAVRDTRERDRAKAQETAGTTRDKSERDIALSDDTTRTAREAQYKAEDKKQDATLEEQNAKDDAERGQLKVELADEQRQQEHGLAALTAAEDRAKGENITTEEAIAEEANEDAPGALEVLERVEQGAVETPKADHAEFTPHRNENAIELMTHAEGASMESRQYGTSAPTATTPAAAESLSNIADYYDIIRGADLGLVVANDNSLSVVKSWFGQYQVRAGEDLTLPSRAADIETAHAQWWQEGADVNGVYVGQPRGLAGVVYRIPRMVASVPSPSRVHYIDPATQQQASEQRVVNPDYFDHEAEKSDVGIGQHQRPAVALSPHLDPHTEFSNQNATLGGFAGQAIKVGPTPDNADLTQEAYQDMLMRRISPGFDPHGTVDPATAPTMTAEEATRQSEGLLGYSHLIKVGDHLQHFNPDGTDEAEERQPEEEAQKDDKAKGAFVPERRN